MTLADRKEKARSLVRAVDSMMARFAGGHPDEPTPTINTLRRDVLRCLAGLYRGNILARTGLTVLAEDIAVAVVIRDAATVREYLYEDCSFQISEPNQIIAEELVMASHSRPVAD